MKGKGKMQKRVLTTEEGLALLGAEQIEKIGPVRLDPISMGTLATRIATRLVSSGGRPTDQSWEIQRKVRMKKATLKTLDELAAASAKEGVHVAPMQLGAIALEQGLPYLKQMKPAMPSAFRGSLEHPEYESSSESSEEGRELCPVIREKGLW